MAAEIYRLMAEAWECVGPGVLGDEDELRARLARRRSGLYARPPRPFCLAIRANDRRITPAKAEIVPTEAIQFGKWDGHQVKVTSELLRFLCRPVNIPAPGMVSTQAAELLGVAPGAIRRMVKDGRLIARYISGLGGRWGHPVPVVHSRGPVDPCSMGGGLLGPERLWDELWRELVVHIPGGLELELKRSATFCTIRGRKAFTGWAWICPACGRRKDTMVMPVDLPDFAALHKVPVPEDELALAPSRPRVMACSRCHRVWGYSAVDGRWLAAVWQHAILHLSGGLLYGNEVERPGWLQVGEARARKYRERDPEHEKNEADRLRRERFTRAFDSGPLYVNGKLNPVFYED